MSLITDHLVQRDEMLTAAEDFLARAADDLRAYTSHELLAVAVQLIEWVMRRVAKLIEEIESLAQVYATSLAELEHMDLGPELLSIGTSR